MGLPCVRKIWNRHVCGWLESPPFGQMRNPGQSAASPGIRRTSREKVTLCNVLHEKRFFSSRRFMLHSTCHQGEFRQLSAEFIGGDITIRTKSHEHLPDERPPGGLFFSPSTCLWRPGSSSEHRMPWRKPGIGRESLHPHGRIWRTGTRRRTAAARHPQAWRT